MSERDPLQDWTRAFLSLVIIVMVAATMVALFWRNVPMSNRDAVMLVLGAMLLRMSDVFAYHFNSTAAAHRKDSIIGTQAKTINAAQSALAPVAGAKDGKPVEVAPGDEVKVVGVEDPE